MSHQYIFTKHIFSVPNYQSNLLDIINTYKINDGKGELNELYDLLLDETVHPKIFSNNDEHPLFQAFKLFSQIIYDFYQNGGGNKERWKISKDFRKFLKKSLNLKQITIIEMTDLQQRFSDILSTIGRGCNFGKVQNTYLCDFHIINMSIDLTYYISKRYFPKHKVFLKEKINSNLKHF